MHDGSRIGLVRHPRRDCVGAAAQVAAWTSSHGVELVAAAADVERLQLQGVTPVDLTELASTVDGLIALGGDGTLLGAAGVLVTPRAPMSGISRTVVVGPAEPLQLELTGGRPAMEVDGVHSGESAAGDVLEITTRPDAGLLMRIDDSRAADRSRVKLSLLDLPLLPDELVELVPDELRPPHPGEQDPTGVDPAGQRSYRG